MSTTTTTAHDHHCDPDDNSRVSATPKRDTAERVRKVVKAVSEKTATTKKEWCDVLFFIVGNPGCEAARFYPLPHTPSSPSLINIRY